MCHTTQHYAGVAKTKKKFKKIFKALIKRTDTNEDGKMSFDEVKTFQFQDLLVTVDLFFVSLFIQVKANYDEYKKTEKRVMDEVIDVAIKTMGGQKLDIHEL